MTATTASPTTTSQSDRDKFVSLRAKILIAFSVVFGIIFAGTFLWFYNFASERALDRLKEDLEILVEGTASGIDGDDFEALINEGEVADNGFTDDPRYWENIDWLQTIKQVDRRTGLYTMTKDPDAPANEYIFVTSASAAPDSEAGGDTPGFLEVVSFDDNPQEFQDLFSGARDETYFFGPYGDQFGRWISGYAPIKNSDDETVAVVGIDFEAEYYNEVRRSLIRTGLPALVATFALMFTGVFILSNFLTQPILSLTQKAQAIGDGDYEQNLTNLSDVAFPDEISKLASVFSVMVAKVSEREKKLKQQVAELRIEIDESKRKQQVDEIVESDFFRELKIKAQNMRERAGKDDKST